jgi:ankyrin repeat protein
MKHLLLTTIAAVVLAGCGESPNELLHQAVIDGNIEAVKQHIATGADVNAKDENGVTPLHWTETEEIAELLIAKGADVNVKDKRGFTPLHNADNKEIAELLIANGADILCAGLACDS